MANIAPTMREELLDYLLRAEAPPALTAPMRVQLLSALGADGVAGTPVAGAIVNASQAAASGDASTNTATYRWEGLANPTTVAGYRFLDSAGTPVVTLDNIPRTGGSVTVTDGIYEVAAGDLDATAA